MSTETKQKLRTFVLEGSVVTYRDLEKILDLNPSLIRKRISKHVGPVSDWPDTAIEIERSWFEGYVKPRNTSRRSDAIYRIFLARTDT